MYFKILLIISLALLLGTLAGYLGNLHVLFDLIGHFKVHLLILSIILILPTYKIRNRIITACVVISLILNIYEVGPWFFPKSQATNEGTSVKLITANVKFNNDNSEPLLSLIEKENPDIIFLQELNEKWTKNLEPLETSYPYQFIEDPKNEFGIGIWSTTPLTNKEIINTGQFKTPSILAQTNINGKTIQLITLHPNPPISKDLFESRNAMFDELENMIHTTTLPIVMGGDFNTTMWSPTYKKLIKNSQLANTRKGFGIEGTWPIGKANYQNFINIQKGQKKGTDLIPRWIVEKHPIKLPIDHVLVSPEIIVENTKAGPKIDSDHLPLITELRIPAEK